MPRRPRTLGSLTPLATTALVLPIIGSCIVLVAGPFAAKWLQQQGGWGVVYFTIAFAILGALTLAPTYTTSIIAGWTFGFARGWPAVIIGTLAGAVMCYVGARWLAGERVISAFREHPRWDVVRRAVAEERADKTLWIVFLLRLSPVLPFGTTNVLLATTGVKLWIYILGTVLGLAPRTALVALAAAGAEKIDFSTGKSWWFLAAGAIATLLCVLIVARIGKHALSRATGV